MLLTDRTPTGLDEVVTFDAEAGGSAFEKV